jgi:hypothetical protein
MSKGKTQNLTSSTSSEVKAKAFTGIQRREAKVLKSGGFNPIKSVRRLRDGN